MSALRQLALTILTSVLIVGPGVAITIAWKNVAVKTIQPSSPYWTVFNVGTLALVTLAYLYFISMIAFVFTRWSGSFEHWPFYRHELSILTGGMIVGLVGGSSAIFGTGIARMRIAWAAIFFGLATFIFFEITLPH